MTITTETKTNPPYQIMVKETQAKALPTWDNCHWKGDDGKVIEVTLKGEHFRWQALQAPKRHLPDKKRGIVSTFSKAARLRMLKSVAEIQWEKALPGLFLTCTYPDSIEIRRRSQVNIHRQVFWRHLEKFMDKHLPALWRVEWMDRKSGGKINYYYPHYHFLIFQQDFISIEKIVHFWRETICSKEKPICWIKRIEEGKKAGVYTAKYSSKVDCSLDNVAYHNSIPTGRNWGFLRKKEIPFCKGVKFRCHNSEFIKGLRNSAAATRQTGVILENESFSLLGDIAKLFASFFLESDLEREEIQV